jgi:NitT/TauT family transport system ATP-binding protein
MSELVSASKVTKRFGAAGPAVLDGVSMHVQPGEIVSILGPSGCGKTTLLRILAGLEEADSGQVRLAGSAAAVRRGPDTGVVFQRPALLGWRTLLDNVLLPAQILKLPPAAARERANMLLAMVGLDGRQDAYPHALSGGMQQRAAIARALLHDPQLVLMDEPFAALDALTRESMQLELLRIQARSGKAFVIVTHSVQEAVFLSSRCYVMSSQPGRIQGTVDVPFGFPRELALKTTEAFGACVRRIYALLGVA